MKQGAYEIEAEGAPKPRITCTLSSTAPDPVPPEQLELAEEVGETLTVLRILFDPKYGPDEERFTEYFQSLVAIARSGLEGPSVRPDVAKKALQTLQAQVTTREAGRVKHRYMKRLGKYAGSSSGLLLLLAFASLFFATVPPLLPFPELISLKELACFLFVLSGCAAGVWLSFGARRPTLTFYELHIPEPDQLHPVTRIAFVLGLTTILTLLFYKSVITVGIGDLKSAQILQKPSVAWLIGALCGFSEQLLAKQVTAQANKLFPNRAADDGSGS